MVIDQATYEIEGFRGEVATHSVRIEDITVLEDGTVEVDFGVMWEPDRDGADETGTSQYLSPTGAIFVNGTEVGETPELSARSSFHSQTTVTVPGASWGDDLRFVFPQNYSTVFTEAVVEGRTEALFDPDAIEVGCQLSAMEVTRGGEMVFIATVTNPNDRDASVSVEWDIDGLRFGADGETVPGNSTVDILVEQAVDLPAGVYDPELSVDASEA